MSTPEALFVTVLGMGVVFFGLILTIGFINIFNRLAKHVKWEGGHGHDAPPVAAAKEAHLSTIESARPQVAAKQSAAPPVPEILAVISTVLEIEQRLNRGLGNQRLTIRR
jgi:Na+-transporting methylmalonyl-CoA/oxaloacetate decarboxylase gamma subunit